MTLFTKAKTEKDNPSDLDLEVAKAFVGMGTRDGDAPIKAGLAKETLISLLFQQADLLAKEGQKKQSATLFEFAMHLSGSQLDKAETKDGFASLENQAQYLLANGRFVVAATVFETLAAAAPDNQEVHLNLAALYFALDRRTDADNLLVEFFGRQPMDATLTDTGGAKKGKLLQMSGYDKSYYKIGSRANGTFQRYRRGGHFMLKHLLNTDPYDLYSYTVCADNITRCAPDVAPDLLLNTIADADTEYRSLKTLETYVASQQTAAVINHPTNVLKTTRDQNYQRLNALPGVRFPRTERFSVGGKSVQTLLTDIETAGFSMPLIIRETGTHTAVTTKLIREKIELERYLADVGGDSVYVIEFIENASPEGHYTKMRFFAIGGILYPVVRHVDEVWNVHGGNRKTFMNGHPWMIEREKQFLADPTSVIGEKATTTLQKLPDFIGLDFFGIDFTLLEDGTVLIFELNPAMRHSFKHAEKSPYMRPHLEVISAAFQAMVERKIDPS